MAHVDKFGRASGGLAEHDVAGGDVVVQQRARFLGVQVIQSGKNLLEEVCGLVERQLAEPRDVLAQQFAAEVHRDHVAPHTLGNHHLAAAHIGNDVFVRQRAADGNLFHLALIVEQALGGVLDDIEFEEKWRAVFVGDAVGLTVGVGLDEILYVILFYLLSVL